MLYEVITNGSKEAEDDDAEDVKILPDADGFSNILEYKISVDPLSVIDMDPQLHVNETFMGQTIGCIFCHSEEQVDTRTAVRNNFV